MTLFIHPMTMAITQKYTIETERQYTLLIFTQHPKMLETKLPIGLAITHKGVKMTQAHIPPKEKVKPPYQRDKGSDYKPRQAVTVESNDICAVCGWSIGTKKYHIHADKAITHEREKCRLAYVRQLSLQPA
jgi:hypothetical protein